MLEILGAQNITKRKVKNKQKFLTYFEQIITTDECKEGFLKSILYVRRATGVSFWSWDFKNFGCKKWGEFFAEISAPHRQKFLHEI